MPDEKETCKPLTKAQEARKTTKPIMEKRRRARINASLIELKALLLDVMKKEGARTNKMEKADILEMTVKHLRTVQRHQFEVAVATDPTTFGKYNSGFNECATEVSRYLNNVDGIETDLKTRLLNHLANCVTSMDSPVPVGRGPPVTAHVRPMQIHPQPSSPLSAVGNSCLKPTAAVPVMTLPEINNNVIPAMHGLTMAGNIYPAPQGGLLARQGNDNHLNAADVAAFVIPSNILSGGQMPGYIIPLYSGQAGKVAQEEKESDKSVAPCPTPKTAPAPTHVQHSPPDSPDNDLKGMDLTTTDKHKADSPSNEVKKEISSDVHVDIEMPFVVPEQPKSVAPAAGEPMWRPW